MAKLRSTKDAEMAKMTTAKVAEMEEHMAKMDTIPRGDDKALSGR